MTPDTLIALATFSVVSCGTPGPNNMMLLSSGATFGFRRTLAHIFGISGGCIVMIVLLGFGLAAVLARMPWLYVLLHIVSTGYLLYLAWRIANSAGVATASARPRPLNFLDAAAFQWVNPKAWAMTLGAVTSFARPDYFGVDIAIIASVICVTGLPCIMLWAGGGTVVRRLLTRSESLRAFNIVMAFLLVASLVPGLIELADRA
jgi:threonine/homoserine/homoserine lactone efflux protein